MSKVEEKTDFERDYTFEKLCESAYPSFAFPFQATLKRSNSGVKMETIEKFSSIPLVESGIKQSLTIYNRVKKTNRLVNWSFETSENVACSVLDSFRPAVKLIEGPLERLDKLGLKVLERFEGECIF